jgi:hypothetical protein
MQPAAAVTRQAAAGTRLAREKGRQMDKHGNAVAKEGQDRCACGCKYWENDRCIDCGRVWEVSHEGR